MPTTATQATRSRKSFRMGLITVVLLMITGIGASASFEARNATSAPTGVQIDPFTMMLGQKDLPTLEVADLSIVFD
jgi:hypothetical protein